MIGAAKTTMAQAKRILSLLLLATGVLLVFAGVTAAVGFSLSGIIASAAAIAALLYSGAVWFGGSQRSDPERLETVFVYDRSLLVASGARRGYPITSCFPASVRADLEARCRAALAGDGARFSCTNGTARVDFDAVPVRTADGVIVYGLLMTAEKSAPPVVNAAAM